MISENKYWVTTIYKLYYINNYSYKDAIYKDQNLWKWNLSIIEKNFMVPMKKYYSILSAKIEKLTKTEFFTVACNSASTGFSLCLLKH